MNQHQSPRTAATLTRLLDEVDPAATQEIAPPDYGAPTRKAVESLIEALSTALCAKVNELRKELDLIEQQALTSAEKSKHVLSEHVALCERINQEIGHVRDTATKLAGQAREP
jgi:hypothetical protein